MNRQPSIVQVVANEAIALAEVLFQNLAQVELPVSPRNELFLAAMMTSLNHFDAVARLAQQGNLISAHALLRPEWEAFVRGLWLKFGATDQEIQDVSGGQDFEFPKIDALMDVVPNDMKAVLKDHKERNWSRLCDYTHTGMISLRRWSNAGSFEPQYPVEQTVVELLRAGEYGAHAATCVAALAADEAMAQRFRRCLHRFLNSAVVDQAANAAPNQKQGTPGDT